MNEQLKTKIEWHLRVIQAIEDVMAGPRLHTWKSQFLKWGEDMPPGFRATMYEEAETAVLLDEDGVPTKFLFVDAYNQLREGAL